VSHEFKLLAVMSVVKSRPSVQHGANLLVLTFGHSGAQPWTPECPKVKKNKNGRLASLASNPLVTVPILKLWAKWVKWWMQGKSCVRTMSHLRFCCEILSCNFSSPQKPRLLQLQKCRANKVASTNHFPLSDHPSQTEWLTCRIGFVFFSKLSDWT